MLAFLKKDKKEENAAKAGSKSDEKQAPTDAVPDELPTLTQDVLNEAIPDESASDAEDIPDELPSLDLNGDTISEPKEESAPAELEPLEVEKPAPAEPVKPVQAQPEPVKAPEPEPEQPSDEGYFANIEDKIKHGEDPQNVLSGMKEHWKKEHKVEEELKTTTQRELEGDVRDLTLELQDLESKWVEQTHNLERSKNFILSVEAEISIKSEELKILLEKLERVENIYKKIKEHQA